MKIEIEPTEKIISMKDLDAEGIPRMCRVWNGVTEKGAKCTIFIMGLTIANTEQAEEFDRDLRHFIPKDTRVYSLRHILN